MPANALKFQVSPFQQRVLDLPEHYNLFLGGGRGGAKSHLKNIIGWQHCLKYGEDAHVLYLRRTYKATADFENLFRQTCQKLEDAGVAKVAHNRQQHEFRFDNGALFEIGQLDTESDFDKYIGKNYSLFLFDEVGLYPSFEWVTLLFSCLRKGHDRVVRRCVLGANPGGLQHYELFTRYVAGREPWEPWEEVVQLPQGKKYRTGKQWVYCPSTYRDNPFINQQEYLGNLLASSSEDPELVKAWVDGDWDISRGAFFSEAISIRRNSTPGWAPDDRTAEWREGWKWFLAHDFGTSKPSVTYVCALSPGACGPDGLWYPRDSLVLVDELATVKPGTTNNGLNWPVDKLAEAVRALADGWDIPSEGIVDDEVFNNKGSSQGSIANEFRRCGVYFQRASKGKRVAGWEVMRRMGANAGKMDEPGLYISQACEYFWRTVPFIPRDPRRPEDADSRSADHAADAARYACLHSGSTLSIEVSEFNL